MERCVKTSHKNTKPVEQLGALTNPTYFKKSKKAGKINL